MSLRFLSATAFLILSKGLMAQNHNTENMMRTMQQQNRMMMINEEQRRFNRFMTSQPMMSSEKMLSFYQKYLDKLNERSSKTETELQTEYNRSEQKKILKQIEKKEQKLAELNKNRNMIEAEMEKLEAKKLQEINKINNK
ncbi:hypothetical protein [Chryseobacterium echinoideorum]|uniref:hypothetical protein n=1 Tax=Chryseobacterium echinoideorum TaxID=1549648 RepID=UPI001186852F|nr:hypothetical protein [Chryseobacterium echinoideorum]